MHAVHGVVDVGRLAQPHLIVEPVRSLHRCLVTAGWIARQTHLHSLQVTDAAVADQFRSIAKLCRRALLAADLQNAPGGLNRIAQYAALRNRQRSRLLQVHVLAGPHRIHADLRVPVVRRAHHHGVDIRFRQQIVIVRIPYNTVIGFPRLVRVEVVHQLLAVFHAMRVQVADGNDLRPVVRQKESHIVTARDTPCADTP